MTFAFAVGLLLDIFNVHDDYILLTASAVALVIGIGLSTRTTFIGTIIIVAATQPFMAAVISEFIPDTPLAPLLFAASGSALIGFSLRNIGLRFVARSAGAVSILIAAIAFSTWDSNLWQPLVGFTIVGLLFTFGANRMHLEIVAAGGLGVTIITGVLAGRLRTCARHLGNWSWRNNCFHLNRYFQKRQRCHLESRYALGAPHTVISAHLCRSITQCFTVPPNCQRRRERTKVRFPI
jgi:hypothetical protein